MASLVNKTNAHTGGFLSSNEGPVVGCTGKGFGVNGCGIKRIAVWWVKVEERRDADLQRKNVEEKRNVKQENAKQKIKGEKEDIEVVLLRIFLILEKDLERSLLEAVMEVGDSL